MPMLTDFLLISALLCAGGGEPVAATKTFDNGVIRFTYPADRELKPVPTTGRDGQQGGGLLLEFGPDAFLSVEAYAGIAEPARFAGARAKSLFDQIALAFAKMEIPVGTPAVSTIPSTAEVGLVAGAVLAYAVGGEPYRIETCVIRAGTVWPVLTVARPEKEPGPIADWAVRIVRDLSAARK